MKAVVVQSPGVVMVKEIPEPIMGEYDALCEVIVCGICSGTDRNVIHNHPYHNVHYPVILGHEGIGRVIACGAKVKHFKVGDVVTRVVNRLPPDSGYELKWGAMAERALAVDWQAMKDDGYPESEWHKHTIHRVLPVGFDPIAATMFITWRETYSYFHGMKPRTGDTVLIIGTGANALSFTDHARNAGLSAIVIGSPKREQIFKGAGAQVFIPHVATDYSAALKGAGVNGVDIIIDTIGTSDSMNRVFPLLHMGGALGVYGLNGFDDYALSLTKGPAHFTYYSGEHYDEGAAHDDVLRLVTEGKLDPWRYLSKDHIYLCEDINKALQASWNGDVMKSVIIF